MLNLHPFPSSPTPAPPVLCCALWGAQVAHLAATLMRVASSWLGLSGPVNELLQQLHNMQNENMSIHIHECVCVSECLLSTLEICLLCANVRKAQRVVAGAKPTLAYLMPPVNTRSACLAWPGMACLPPRAYIFRTKLTKRVKG